MKIKYILLILAIHAVFNLQALSNDDLRWLTDREQFQIIQKHAESILFKAYNGDRNDIKAVLDYAQRSDQPGLAILCHKRLATEQKSLEDALQWLLLMQTSEVDSTEFNAELASIKSAFSNPADALIFDFYSLGTPEKDMLMAVTKMDSYNTVIETMAKGIIDEISVQSSDSLALAMIVEFEQTFPRSKYAQIAYYYKLYHLSNQKNWIALNEAIDQLGKQDCIHAYISALFLMSPSYRRDSGNNSGSLSKAAQLLLSSKSTSGQFLLYDYYAAEDWHSRVSLQEIKVDYYETLADHGLFGDETDLSMLPNIPKHLLSKLFRKFSGIRFANNDRGENAELNYWLGRTHLLSKSRSNRIKAARFFGESMRMGSPRRKYDNDSMAALGFLKLKLAIEMDLMVWMRKLFRYQGIVFEDITEQCGLADKRYSRVALGDYNSDGLNDILFSGKYLYRNEGNLRLTDVSDSTNLRTLNSNGGLFADFNRDGLLDIVSLSHADDGKGEQLMKNMDGKRFVSVNERAGDIDDRYPTEAAAWVDIDNRGYPSLYTANYEKWQQQSGYPDFFWHNKSGYFSDQSVAQGFLFPDYTRSPGQAGRGVAPADFDNDGHQEILVTNYRLNRNFCWKQVDTLFIDVAPLYNLTGKFKQGYYGHSIGADWGDIDNDGDLDLFIANLAHPRYLDISDISMLLRNDGLACKVVEGDSIYYWQFTDITASAGITFDELHSDPLFFDADNDGFLDLFITSVYENDRSYLYRNNGDNTFTDITWLAGARVFNGWGNAAGDLDCDGLLDLVVGSGNGAKVFHNITTTKNKSVFVKPVWKGEKIYLESDSSLFSSVPQSPAFGTKVVVSLQNPNGKRYDLIRELSSAKGTASQSASELHFGIGRSKVLEIKRFTP